MADIRRTLRCREWALRQREMVYTVNVASPESYRGDSTRGRLTCDHHDMGKGAFAVADQVQRLGPGILRAIASQRPFGADARVQQGRFSVAVAQIASPRNDGIDQEFRAIDVLVGFQVAGDDHIRGDSIIVAQCGGQFGVFGGGFPQGDQVCVLGVFRNFAAVPVADLADAPSSRTEVRQTAESGVHEACHEILELIAGGLAGAADSGFRPKPSGDARSDADTGAVILVGVTWHAISVDGEQRVEQRRMKIHACPADERLGAAHAAPRRRVWEPAFRAMAIREATARATGGGKAFPT